MGQKLTAYSVVVLLGVAVGVAEIISTFSNSPIPVMEALTTTGWAVGLVAINTLAAAVVLFIILYTREPSKPIMAALAVGLGLPTLVRTKFTIAKPIGGSVGNDLSIDLVLTALPPAPGEPEALAIDGKTLRGSRKQGAPAAHLLSVLSHRLGLTLWQQAVADKTNEIPVLEDVLHAWSSRAG